MSIKTELSKLGSGPGLIYLTDSSDNITGFQYANDKDGRDAAERKMLVSASLSSNISAVSSASFDKWWTK